MSLRQLGRILQSPPACAANVIGQKRDPLVALSDDFSGSDDLATRGWTVYNAADLSDDTISSGELHLSTTTGGDPGTHWYSQISGPQERDGALIYKLIRGNFDARLRIRIRNAANTGSPSAAAGEWRFAGLQAQDPAGLISGEYNYAHVALGSDPNGQNRIEWKVTDSGGATGPQSTYDSDAGSADLDYDLRLVRRGQAIDLYYRRTDAGEALPSNTGWVALSVGTLLKDSATPARIGSATPVAFPDELAVGIMPPYAGPQTSVDLQAWCEDIRFKKA